MKHTVARRLVLSLICFVFVACEKPKRPGVPPKHLLLFTFDGMRADHVSALGSFRPTTFGAPDDPGFTKKPGLDFDAIADRGVLFANAFAPSLDEYESLAALWSAVAPGRGSAPSLAEALRDSGMHTIASVSGLDDRFQAGFEIYETHDNDKDAISRAWYLAKTAIEDESIDRICVWVHLAEIAPPFAASPLPKVITERAMPELFRDPNYPGSLDGSLASLERVASGEHVLTPEDREYLLASYDAELARTAALFRAFLERWAYTVKDSFGTYVDAPHEDERWDRTLVVGCGIRGMELGERGSETRWGEASRLHDASLRVPLFFSHTQSLTGKRILDTVCDLTDVAPTLREWFELEMPSAVTGRSLLPVMDTYAELPFTERPAILEGPGGALSIRNLEWRYLRDESGEFLYRVRDNRQLPEDVADEEPELVEEFGRGN